MATERPILLISSSRTVQRLTGSPDSRQRPSYTFQQQSGRLGPRFDRIRETLNSVAVTGAFTADATSIVPDRALVFELKSELKDFEREAMRIGLVWLTEEAEQHGEFLDDEVEEIELEDEEEEALTSGETRLYVSMPSLQALNTLLQHWDAFRSGAKAPYGYGQWWKIFERLESIRPWGVEDRLDDKTLRYLRQKLQENPQASALVEMDIWFSDDPLVRNARQTALTTLVTEHSGQVHDTFVLTNINYHGLLAELPSNQVQSLTERAGSIANANQVMAIRAQSYGDHPINESRTPIEEDEQAAEELDGLRAPVAALLDGFPIENHSLLANRLDVYPLDIDGSMVPVSRRVHGTQMASLILHGDLDDGGAALTRRLLVVPVLQPDHTGMRERTPERRLALKVIFRAVEAIKAGQDGDDPIGPDVVLINHSIGDAAAPFISRPTFWAKLLDHLAIRFNVLFVVSAGNIHGGVELSEFADIASFRAANPQARRDAILRAIERRKHHRTMLSPAESINSITVGACHADGSTEAWPAAATDPFDGQRFANIGSGLGLGVAGAVKPDFILPGGRQAAQPLAGATFQIYGHQIEQLGQRAAVPDHVAARLNLTHRSTGTSNAAALATRAGIQVVGAVEELFALEPDNFEKLHPAIIRCLLAHGCGWGAAGNTLESICPPTDGQAWSRRRTAISRFIGYGEPDITRVLECTSKRVTYLGIGTVKNNKRDVYEIPLPEALSSRVDIRRVVTTLAWVSPIRPKARNYRAIKLQLTGSGGSTDVWAGVARKDVLQPPASIASRGTLIHAVHRGAKAIPYASGSSFEIGVQAMASVSSFNQYMVPYALAVSFEVADSIQSDIYTEARAVLEARARVARVTVR